MAEFALFPAVGALPEISLETEGAWQAENYLELYAALDQVGENRPIPGVTGRLPIPREEDELVFGIPLIVYGLNGPDGVTPYVDARVGLRTNLRFLRTNLFRPPGTADGTRPFEFHELGGYVEGGDVEVAQGALGYVGPTAARLTVRVTVPAGLLVEIP